MSKNYIIKKFSSNTRESVLYPDPIQAVGKVSMAVTFPHSTFSPPSASLPRSSPTQFFSPRCSSSASTPMDPQNGGRRTFMEFPYVSAPHRDLMVELVSTVENRLDPYLLPCKLPPDVQYYENQSGTAHAALQVRSGIQSSQVLEFFP